MPLPMAAKRHSELVQGAQLAILGRIGPSSTLGHYMFWYWAANVSYQSTARTGLGFETETALNDRNEIDYAEMEKIRPPAPPVPGPGDPRIATLTDIERLKGLEALARSIAGAAALYQGSCQGGDSYDNNCANYLSDAFLRAGYNELKPPATCINARCGTASKRPIRARDMRCWFENMATETRNKLPSNEGFWAVFQLNEPVYWGGHVVIIDTDNNIAYGTGNYPNWDQFCFKW